MTSQSSKTAQPPDQVIMQMVLGKWVSQSLTVAAELGIADHLGDQSLTSEELAHRVDAHPESLYRLLRALASVGVFEESEARVFTNNDLSHSLRQDAENSMWAMARWIGEDSAWRAWSKLRYSVQTGKPGFDEMFGSDFFSYAGQHQSTLERFQAAMTGFSVGTGHAVIDAYDFSGIRSIVDVGGGHGAMLAGIVQNNPELRGVVYELPEVAEAASKALAEHPQAARLSAEAGSFIDGVPKGHDAYIMKFIIHDWNDDACVTLLNHCREGLQEGGRILIVEQVLSNDESAQLSKLMDLEMLVLTPGGRERSEADFRALLDKAGLELTRIVPTQSPVSVIEARPR